MPINPKVEALAKCQTDGAATKYFSKDFSSIQNTLFFPGGQLKAQTQN